MPEHRFETHQPIRLFVEIDGGTVRIAATDTTETEVEVTGPEADEVVVVQDGDLVSVLGPRHIGFGFFGRHRQLQVDVRLPARSQLKIRTGSADVEVTGEAGPAQVRSGSGDVTIETLLGRAIIETGAGDIRINRADRELRVRSGSGDIVIHEARSEIATSTGSGDVVLDTCRGDAVVKTGSGDLRIEEAQSEVSMSTGSGDCVVHAMRGPRIAVKGASSDILLGVPAGLPVWTDISTISGEVASELTSVGAPTEGQPHLEIRAVTVSGDVRLRQI